MWRAVRARMSVSDAPGGGSNLTLISAAGHEGERVGPAEARRQFELRVLEPLQRNEPNTLHAVPYVLGTEKSFVPRIVAPRSLAESRARVTITLNRPSYVALVEVTPDEHWRLLYPARPEDERRLGPGTHTLATACAAEPDTAPIAPDLPIPPCARARPVTPREVGLLARKNIGRDCRDEHAPGIRAGTLALVATDRPLRRTTLQAQLEGYCGSTYFFDPGTSPLVRAVHASGTRKWAAAEVFLRR
jgi:hypothetical protein